ncbi:uncharacterized protein LOC115529182 [Gadus morhua]|uniref:uncharacterized protein LOC115529182 n=1 Tax=Gadus morhua TaxID=8049 RepID=UPI0011B478DC|nr:uncharacterized protein LOC115529182 [Gadus morhua]
MMSAGWCGCCSSTASRESRTSCRRSDCSFCHKVTPHLKVRSDAPFPEAPALPTSLPPPDRPQVQYRHIHHEAGKRRGEKRRLFVDEPEHATPANRPVQPTGFVVLHPAEACCAHPHSAEASCAHPPPAEATRCVDLRPTPCVGSTHTAGPPRTATILFRGTSCSQSFVPPAPTVKTFMPNKSSRPCGACHVPNCGGQWKRYTPSKDKVAGSMQKKFSYCPSTRMSTTPGFYNVVYENFELFKNVVDAELERRTV